MAVDDGLLGYIFQTIDRKIQLWKRSADYDGDSGWVLERSIDQDKLLAQNSYDGSPTEIVGIAEEYNVFFLQTKSGVFKVHAESMQCKKVSEMSGKYACHFIRKCLYTAGV